MSVQLHTSPPDGARSRPAPRRRRCCQVAGCGGPFWRSVEIQLPAAWEASRTYSVLTVRVDTCGDCAEELKRRAAALLQGRADICQLLFVVEAAAVTEAEQREQIAGVAEAALRAARGGRR